MEVEVAGVDRQARRELAVRHRRLRLAEHLQHLQPQRMTERLQLLGPVDLEDVLRDVVRLGARSSAS